jgi:hypothetical protein
LPRDYVEWAKVYHGSNPGCYIDVDGEPYPFDQWLSISSEAEDYDDFCHVMGTYRQMYFTNNFDPSFPKGFVRFALDRQNKGYCFNYDPDCVVTDMADVHKRGLVETIVVLELC